MKGVGDAVRRGLVDGGVSTFDCLVYCCVYNITTPKRGSFSHAEVQNKGDTHESRERIERCGGDWIMIEHGCSSEFLCLAKSQTCGSRRLSSTKSTSPSPPILHSLASKFAHVKKKKTNRINSYHHRGGTATAGLPCPIDLALSACTS